MFCTVKKNRKTVNVVLVPKQGQHSLATHLPLTTLVISACPLWIYIIGGTIKALLSATAILYSYIPTTKFLTFLTLSRTALI